MLAINLSEMWPCIFGSYTNMIAAQIHLQCVSIKPSSDIWSLSVIINKDIVIVIKVTMREEFDTPTTQDIRQWRLFLAS